jgi:hypothetical protein
VILPAERRIFQSNLVSPPALARKEENLTIWRISELAIGGRPKVDSRVFSTNQVADYFDRQQPEREII